MLFLANLVQVSIVVSSLHNKGEKHNFGLVWSGEMGVVYVFININFVINDKIGYIFITNDCKSNLYHTCLEIR